MSNCKDCTHCKGEFEFAKCHNPDVHTVRQNHVTGGWGYDFGYCDLKRKYDECDGVNHFTQRKYNLWTKITDYFRK